MESYNLVFLPDSNYSEVIYNNFEEIAKDKNIYVCFTREKAVYLKKDKINYIWFDYLGNFKGDLSFLNNKFDKIFFNLNTLFTTHFYYKYIDKNPNFDKTKLVFMFWSGELYNHPAYKGKIFDNHAAKYSKIYKKIFSAKPVDKLLNLLNMPSYSKYFELNKKMEYFCGFLESEHKIFNDVFGSNSRFVLFTFLNLELLKLPENIFGSEKEDILIGNSGSLENNHYEVLETLKNTNPDDFGVIIAPLSYGNKKYSDSIIEFGNSIFKEKFVPITSFLAREEYNNKLSKVKVAFFNHYIQQAMGNIFFMLYLGGRIYFNKNNPLYKGFIDTGFIVSSLDEFDTYKVSGLKPEEIEHNRNLLVKFLNKESSYNYYKNIIEL